MPETTPTNALSGARTIADQPRDVDQGDKKGFPRPFRPLIKAPKALLLLRLSMILIGASYYLFHASDPLVVNPLGVISISVALGMAHLLLHVLFMVKRFNAEYTILPMWIDIGACLSIWLIDPLKPSPMLILILAASLFNGVHNGFYAFRNILWVAIPAAPLIYLTRSMVHGFHPDELILLAFGTFLLLYLYFVILNINTLQDKSIKETADIVDTNKQLQKTGDALQESEARYRAMFEDSGAATVLAEEKTTLITLVNSKFEHLTGYKKTELCNVKRLSDLINTDDMAKIRRFQYGRRAKPDGKSHPAEFECRMPDKKGNTKYVVIRFGLNVWHERLIVTMVDITAGMQAKIAMQKYSAHLLAVTKKLQESGIRYRNLFENTGTATILVEKNLRISMANSKFEELTGFSKKEILNNKRVTEFIEKRSLFRIRRFHARIKKQNLPLPNEYECLIRDRTKNIRHVIMTVYTQPGQDNSIVSFFDITARKKAEEQLQAAHERLKVMAISDELTGLANRRHFNDCFMREWNRSMRELTPLSLILIDVDCFKAYNDTYGHQAGDRCLKEIASKIKHKSRRAIDVTARYGGEEFAVIMPNTDLAGALTVAESMRVGIEKSRMIHASSQAAPFVTLSLGVAAIAHFSDTDSEQLIKKADQALYEAKRKGRNRTAVSTAGVDDPDALFKYDSLVKSRTQTTL